MTRALLALLSVLALSGPVAGEPMEVADYVLIAPQAVANGARIEVIEFFYYGCGACYRFEPQLRGWLKAQPSDVIFRRVPALRRQDWVPLTRLYFALEQLGELDRLHGEVYASLHEKDTNLGELSEALVWGEQHGLDRSRFEQALRSDTVAGRVQEARDATVAYGVRATPTLVVDGKYLTSPGITGSIDALLQVLDGLIEKARKTRAGK